MTTVVGVLIGIVIGALFGGLIIWLVAKIGLGIEVDGFGSAFIAAIVIAIIGGIINWGLGLIGITIGGGLLGAVIHLVVAAVVLMISDKFLSGLKVAGFTGALIAAAAIGVVHYLISLLVGLLV